MSKKEDLLLHLGSRPTWTAARCMEIVGVTSGQVSGWKKKDPEFRASYEKVAASRKEAQEEIGRRIKMTRPPEMAEESEVRKVLAHFDTYPMKGFESACKAYLQDPCQVMKAIKASPELHSIYRISLGSIVEPVERKFIEDLLAPDQGVRREKFLGRHHPDIYGNPPAEQQQKDNSKPDVVNVNILIQEVNQRLRHAEIDGSGQPIFIDLKDEDLVASSELPRALKRVGPAAPVGRDAV